MLPDRGSPEDIYKIAQYLQSKPAGDDISSLQATLSNKLVSQRKLRAFEQWGVISIEGEVVKLQPDARDLTDPEYRASFFKEVIANVTPYRKAIEKAHHGKKEQWSKEDLAAFWYDHYLEEVGTENNDTLNSIVTTFFRVADEAGFGSYKRGGGKYPTRLELDKDATTDFVTEYLPSFDSEEGEANETTTNSDTESTPTSRSEVEPGASVEHQNQSTPNTTSFSQGLHIDLNIHISADASHDQIDSIFESMAKHLNI